MSSLQKLLAECRALANPEKAKILARFFKTGKGEYGEGDKFLGITVPQTRAIVKKYTKIAPLGRGVPKAGGLIKLEDITTLLLSPYHEIRLAGVLFLVYFAEKKIYPIQEIAECYLRNAGLETPFLKGDVRNSGQRDLGKNKSSVTPASGQLLQKGAQMRINNWDLVDVSSPQIIGPYLHSLSKKAREEFVQNCVESPSLWINRIIVLASFYDIKSGNSQLTLFLAEKFLHHKHDLMHKAVGWMLREVGKRCSIDELRGFLDKHASKMPRTMLRYAIEKMDERERRKYLTKKM